MSARKTETDATSRSSRPAAPNVKARLENTRRACSSSGRSFTHCPLTGSRGTCPETKTNPAASTAGENAPAGGACSGDSSIGVQEPATPTITLHVDLFMLPPLPLLTDCDGEPIIPQVHYYHNDVAVSARFCYRLGGGFRSTLGGSHARRFTRPRRVCPGRVHNRCSRSSTPDTFRYNPANAKAGGCIGC